MSRQHHPSTGFSRGSVVLATAGAVLAALVVGGVLWAKGNMTWIKQKMGGSAWYLTYEAGAAGGEPRATEIRYEHNPDRYEDERRTDRTGAAALPWKTRVMVNTGQEARLEVRPAPGTTATCRILLDGARVVAEGRSPAPGKPAVCEVVTSSTPESWPR